MGFSIPKEDYNPIAYIDKDNVASIAEVVMWLYERYKIWIWVSCREKDDGSGDILFVANGRNIPIKKKYGFVVDTVLYQSYESPTEAYEAGIKHVLTETIKI